MPNSGMSALRKLCHVIQTILEGRHYYYGPKFSDEETEVWRSQLTCLKLQKLASGWAKPRIQLGRSQKKIPICRAPASFW